MMQKNSKFCLPSASNSSVLCAKPQSKLPVHPFWSMISDVCLAFGCKKSEAYRRYNITHFLGVSSMLRIDRVMILLMAMLWIIASPQLNSVHAKETKYAAFIMHADSGDILFDRYSTAHRYPASLTKMMTLYLLFEEIESGRMSLKSKIKVSKTAAAQPPSKLGLRAGSTINTETAIKALVVKSANDVAVVVAERLGGTEWRFARRMTQRARQLGMHRTTFKNASGLPNSKQLTTARDMAELSRRLFQDFPQYKHYFKTKQFTYKNRTYTTHNSLVKNYPGADGIKTGYTRRSGFNLATSAERENNKLIGIVLGGRSSHTRDKHMREILDNAFATLKRKPQLISALHRNTPTPILKPSPYGNAPTIAGNTQLQATLQNAQRSFTGTIPEDDPVSSLIIASEETDQSRPAGIATFNPDTPPENDQVASLISREDNSYQSAQGDIDEDSLLKSIITAPKNIHNLPWAVQIGAYSTSDYAYQELEKAAKLARLDHAPRDVSTLAVSGRPALYRARFFYLDRVRAKEACQGLKQIGIGCFVASNKAAS